MATMPKMLFPGKFIPTVIWCKILSYIELPFTLSITKETIRRFRYRPITIAWTQTPKVSQRFFGVSRDTLYSCDTENMLVFTNDEGRDCFGVKPDVLFRTTPILKIDLEDRSIIGFFAVTTALPIDKIPQKFAKSIDINDPTTWVYSTDSPLDMYSYGFWKMINKDDQYSSFNEHYMTISMDQHVCINE